MKTEAIRAAFICTEVTSQMYYKIADQVNKSEKGQRERWPMWQLPWKREVKGCMRE